MSTHLAEMLLDIKYHGTVTAAGSGGTIRSGRTCGKETCGNPVGMPPNSGNHNWIELSALTGNCSKLYPARGILFS
jgi:hypothetical protein